MEKDLKKEEDIFQILVFVGLSETLGLEGESKWREHICFSIDM